MEWEKKEAKKRVIQSGKYDRNLNEESQNQVVPKEAQPDFVEKSQTSYYESSDDFRESSQDNNTRAIGATLLENLAEKATTS